MAKVVGNNAGQGEGAFSAVVQAPAGGHVTIANADFLQSAEYHRAGPDLILEGPDGTRVLVKDFFSQHPIPSLVSADGAATIDGGIANTLAGSMAPGQYAQAAGTTAQHPIGTVSVQNGSVTVKHADGSRTVLKKGDPVFPDDVIETGQGGAVGVTFEDGTTFSLGSGGRMVLDDLVYDPESHTGSGNIAVLKGAFTFVSGQIPKTAPEALTIKTPAMIVGIRGTGGAGNTQTVVLLAEAGGVAGELVVTTPSGQTLTINVPGLAASVSATGSLLSVQMSPAQVQALAGNSLSALPNPNSLAPAYNPNNNNNNNQDQPIQPPPPSTIQQQTQAVQNAVEQALALQKSVKDAADTQRDIIGIKDLINTIPPKVDQVRNEIIKTLDEADAARAREEAAAVAEVQRITDLIRAKQIIAHAAYVASESALTTSAIDGQITIIQNALDDSNPATDEIASLYALAQAAAKNFSAAINALSVATTLKTSVQTDLALAQLHRNALADPTNTAAANAWRDNSAITDKLAKVSTSETAQNDLESKRLASDQAAADAAAARSAARPALIQEAAAAAVRDIQSQILAASRIGLVKAIDDYVASYGQSAHASDWYSIDGSVTSALSDYKSALATYLTNHPGATAKDAVVDTSDTTVAAKLTALLAVVNNTSVTTDIADNAYAQAVQMWISTEASVKTDYNNAVATYNAAHTAANTARSTVSSDESAATTAAGNYSNALTSASNAAVAAAIAVKTEMYDATAAQMQVESMMSAALQSVLGDMGSNSDTTTGTVLGDVAVAAQKAAAALAAATEANANSTIAANARALVLGAVNDITQRLNEIDAAIGSSGHPAAFTAYNAKDLSDDLPASLSQADATAQAIANQVMAKAAADYDKLLAIRADLLQQQALANSYLEQANQAVDKATAYEALAHAADAAAAVSAATTAKANADSASTAASAAARQLDGNSGNDGSATDVAAAIAARVTALTTGSKPLDAMNTNLGTAQTAFDGIAGSLGNSVLAAKISAAQTALSNAATQMNSANSLVTGAAAQVAAKSAAAAAAAQAAADADAAALTAKNAALAAQAASDATAASNAAKTALTQATIAAEKAALAAQQVQALATYQNSMDSAVATATTAVKTAIETVNWAKALYGALSSRDAAVTAVNSSASSTDASDNKAAITGDLATLTAASGKWTQLAGWNTAYASNTADKEAAAAIAAAYARALAAKASMDSASGDATTQANSALSQLETAQTKTAAALAATTLSDALRLSAEAQNAAAEAQRLAAIVTTDKTQSDTAKAIIEKAFTEAQAAVAALAVATQMQTYAGTAQAKLTLVQTDHAALVQDLATAQTKATAITAQMNAATPDLGAALTAKEAAQAAASDAAIQKAAAQSAYDLAKAAADSATTYYNSLTTAQKTSVVTAYYNQAIKAAADSKTLLDDAALKLTAAQGAATAATADYNTLVTYQGDLNTLRVATIDAAAAKALDAKTVAETRATEAAALYTATSITVTTDLAAATALGNDLAAYLAKSANTSVSALQTSLNDSVSALQTSLNDLTSSINSALAKLSALKISIDTAKTDATTAYNDVHNNLDPLTTPSSGNVTTAQNDAALASAKADLAVSLRAAMNQQIALINDKLNQVAVLRAQFQSLANDAPALTNTAAITLAAITEDIGDGSANAGFTIGSLIASRATDAETASTSLGMALTGLSDAGGGKWQYTNGTTWTDVPANLDSAHALLLKATDQLRFVPNADWNSQQGGHSAPTITFHAWDGGDGAAYSQVDLSGASATGGFTAFSTATATASLTVSAVNDAPKLVNSIHFDGATARMLVPTVNDTKFGGGEEFTIAMRVRPEAGGMLFRQDAYSGELGIVTRVNADGTIEVAFDAQSSGGWDWFHTAAGTVSLGEWHQIAVVKTTGGGVTLYVDGVATALLDTGGNVVTSLTGNRLTATQSSAGTFFGYSGDPGTPDAFKGDLGELALFNKALNGTGVQNWGNGSLSGGDLTALKADYQFGAGSGSTVPDATGANGTLNLNALATGGGTAPGWTTPATVAASVAEDTTLHGQVAATDIDGGTVAFTVKTQAAHGVISVDAATGKWSYVPTADYNGADSAVLRVADGQGGFTDVTLSLTVTAVNDAPVLSGSAPALTTIAEDVASAANAGSTVASLLSGHATDVDSTGLGMRITALNDQSGGVWQYKTQAGDWTAMGTLPHTLAATDSVRFVPNADWNSQQGGHSAPTFTFQAWDGTAASSASLTASVTVSAVNDAPVIALPGTGLQVGGGTYASIPHSAALNVESAYTIEMWVKLSDVTTETVLFEKGSWQNDLFLLTKPHNGGVVFTMAGPGLTFASSSSFEQYSTTTLQADTWYHLAATWDGTTSKLYVNGTLEASESPAGTLTPSTEDIHIGSRPNGTFPASGVIDDVRLWNTPRDATQVLADKNSAAVAADSTLVAHWTFNEGTGTTAADSSGNGHDATLVGAGWDSGISDAGTVTAAYTENGPAVIVAGQLGLSDVDGTTLTGATVTIGAGKVSGDLLAFTAQAGITGSYNASTGILTLSGTASLADYATALRSVTFSSASDNPGTSRSISFSVNDGTSSSAPFNATIAVTPVNDAPVVSGLGSPVIVGADGGAIAAFAGTAAVSDPDSSKFSALTITLNGGKAGDILDIDSPNGSSFDLDGGSVYYYDANGVRDGYGIISRAADHSLTITFNPDHLPSATVINDLIKGIQFSSISVEGGTRSLSVTVTDDAGATSTAASRAIEVNTPPKLIVSAADLNDGVEFGQTAYAASAQGTHVNTLIDDLTVEIRFKWSGNDAGPEQVLFYNGDSGLDGYGLTIAGGQFILLAGGVTSLPTGVPVPSGDWHHVALVRDGGQWSLYLDGAKTAFTSDITPNAIANGQTIIGNATELSYGFQGTIDDVAVWSEARTAPQIAADQYGIVGTRNLDGHWGGSISGGTLTDLTANGLDLTVASSVTMTPVPAATAIDGLTVEIAFSWNGRNVGQSLFFNGDSELGGYGLSIVNGTFAITTGGRAQSDTGIAVPVGGTHNVALVRDGGIWKLYLDGVDQSISVTDAPSDISGGFTVIGNDDLLMSAFQGTITSVALWNGARSASDITADIASISPSASGLVAHWTGNSQAGPMQDSSIHAVEVAATAPFETLVGLTATKGTASTFTLTTSEDPSATITIIDQPDHGTITVTGHTYTYTPAAGYVGTDTFTVRTLDSQGASQTYGLEVQVHDSNAAPTSNAVPSIAAGVATPVDVGLSSYFHDSDAADSLVYGASNDMPSWLHLDSATGRLSGTPPGTNNAATFTVTATDRAGLTTSQTITLTMPEISVAGVNAPGSSLYFGGGDAALTKTSTMSSAAGTIELWVQMADWQPGTEQFIIGNGIAQGDPDAIALGLGASGLVVHYGGSTQPNTLSLTSLTSGFADGSWHHVAFSWEAVGNQTQLNLYVDGILMDTDATALNIGPQSLGDWRVGGSAGGTDALAGMVGAVDNVRLWNDTRTAGEIAGNYPVKTAISGDHLVADWRMDGLTESGDINDSTGNENYLHLSGATRLNPPGQVLNLNGGYVELQGAVVTEFMTIEAWVKPNQLQPGDSGFTTAFSPIYSVGSPGTVGYMAVGYNAEGLLTLRYYDSGQNETFNIAQSTGHLTADMWSHVAVVIGPSEVGHSVTLYVNGVEVGGGETPEQPVGAVNNAYVGHTQDGASLDGGIADVRIYDAARTPGDIALDMNSRLTGDEYGLLLGLSLDRTYSDGSNVWFNTEHSSDDPAFTGAWLQGPGSIGGTKEASYSTTLTVNEDTAVTTKILAVDSSSHALSYSIASNHQPSHGSVEVKNDGTLTYKPNDNYTGDDSFTLRVTDNHGTTVEKVISVTVKPVDDTVTAEPPPTVDFGALSLYGNTSVSVAGGLNTGNSAVTYEAWMRYDPGVTGTQTLLAAGSGANAAILTVDGNGQLTFSIGGHPVAVMLDGNLGAWHHVAAAAQTDGAGITTLVLYLDGQAAATARGAFTYSVSGGGATLGASQSATDYLHGKLSDVRVYTDALNQSEVQADMAGAVSDAPHLFARWQFNETNGTAVADSSGGTHTGTVTGSHYDWDDRVLGVVNAGNTLNVSGLTLYDPDTASGQDTTPAEIQVTLTASHGTIGLDNVAGLSYSNGIGTNTVMLLGSLAALNDALAQVSYTPDSGFSGNDGIKVVIDEMAANLTRRDGGTVPVFVLAAPTDGNDNLIGSPFADIIDGLAGDDIIAGLGGADTLTGGAGADSFSYSDASESNISAMDRITDFNAAQGDSIAMSAAFGMDYTATAYSAVQATVSATIGTILADPATRDQVVFFTQGGNGYLVFHGIDNHVQANGTVIRLDGVTTPPPQGAIQGMMTLSGTAAPDLLTGTAGADIIGGGAGRDTIDGGDGDDIIIGGANGDVLTGGAGSDVFTYTAANQSNAADPDTITDFTSGSDQIVFNGIGPVAYDSSPYAAVESTLGATIATIQADQGITNRVVFFTLAGDGYLYVKASGNTYDGSLIRLAQTTVPPMLQDLPGLTDPAAITVTGSGNSPLSGTHQADTLTGAANQTVFGLGGNDTIVGGAGGTVVGGIGQDVLSGGTGTVYLYTSPAESSWATEYDIVTLQAGQKIAFQGMDGITYNTSYGSAASLDAALSDILGNSSFDNKAVFFTLAGDGYLFVKGSGSGASFDGFTVKLVGQGTAPDLSALLGVSPDTISLDSTDNSESLTGDQIQVIDGGLGNDTLDTWGGNDTLIGGDGADKLTGGDGRDVFVYNSKTESTQSTMDRIMDFDGNYDRIKFTGMAGMTYSGTVTPVGNPADLNAAVAAITGSDQVVFFIFQGDGYIYVKGTGSGTDFDGTLIRLVGVTTAPVLGSILTGSNLIVGDDLSNTLVGGDDANTLIGQGGADTLIGAAGDDTLIGGAGDDYLNGGGGNDVYVAGTDSDVIVTGGGLDSLIIEQNNVVTDVYRDGNDLVFESVDGTTTIRGQFSSGGIASATLNLADHYGGMDTYTLGAASAASDLIVGDGSNDTLAGGNGSDILIGAAGDDTLFGGAGMDFLRGDAGSDTLVGGMEGDVMTGGAGADVFRFFSAADSSLGEWDVITDFTPGIDRLDLVGLGGLSGLALRSLSGFQPTPANILAQIANNATIPENSIVTWVWDGSTYVCVKAANTPMDALFIQLRGTTTALTSSDILQLQTVTADGAAKAWDGDGGSDHSWSLAANWGTDTLPTSNSDVSISGASVTYDLADPAYIRSLTAAGTTLNISSGGLYLSKASTLDGGSSLQLSGTGILGGNGKVTLGGGLVWSGGSILSGQGIWVAGTATISDNTTHTLDTILALGGTTTLSNTVISGNGDLLNGGDMSVVDSSNVLTAFANSGQLNIISDASFTNVNLTTAGDLMNTGTITLDARDGSSDVVSLTMAAGSSLFLGDGSSLIAADDGGANHRVEGRIDMVGGTITAHDGLVIDTEGDDLFVSSGTLWTDPAKVMNIDLTDGGKIDLDGALTIDGGGHVSVQGFNNATWSDGSVFIKNSAALDLDSGLTLGDHFGLSMSVGNNGTGHLSLSGTLAAGGTFTAVQNGEVTSGTGYNVVDYTGFAGHFAQLLGLDNVGSDVLLDPIFSGSGFSLIGRAVSNNSTTGGDDSFTGNMASADYLLLGAGNDTVQVGHGQDVVFGQAGNDTIGIDGNDFHLLDGGTGIDTLRFDGADGATLNLGTLSGILQNFEKISLEASGNQNLLISRDTILGMTGTGTNALTNSEHTMVITGNSGDNLALSGGSWAQTSASANIGDGNSYSVYTSHDGDKTVTVYVDNHINTSQA